MLKNWHKLISCYSKCHKPLTSFVNIKQCQFLILIELKTTDCFDFSVFFLPLQKFGQIVWQ